MDSTSNAERDAPQTPPTAKEIQAHLQRTVRMTQLAFLCAVTYERDRQLRICPTNIMTKLRAAQ